uniref:8.9 kDa family member n=1 Tax=Rhipicephalus zambeziensis TaxID=60191 RepID=A0A224YA40_9ACAR
MKHLLALVYFCLLLTVIAEEAAESEHSNSVGGDNKNIDGTSNPPQSGDEGESQTNPISEESSSQEEEQEEDSDEDSDENSNGERSPANCTYNDKEIPNGQWITAHFPLMKTCLKVACDDGRVTYDMCPFLQDAGSRCKTVIYDNTTFPECCPINQCS